MKMSSCPLSVRRATLADADHVAKCVEAAYGKWIPVIGTKPGPMRDDYRKVIASDIVFVAEQAGKIVGVLVLSEDAEGFLLENVAVHPDASGRGIGRALLALAENEARAGGHAQIHLYTHERMASNIALYERHGYVEYAHRVESGFARIYMRKQLQRGDA